MNFNIHNLPERITPQSLSENFEDIVFDVPIYQRLFAWRDEQVCKLMYDLYEAYPKGEPYYLGILTVVVNANNKQLDLIDGQQRITVTTLMAIAFKELQPEKCAYWNSFLAGGKRLVFSARDEDSEYISNRAQGKNTTSANYQMEDAIGVIKKWCLDNNIDVVRFSNYVWENLTLFCSYLPSHYVDNPVELNRYFEAMNSTGRQLKQHEILLVDLVAGHPNSVALSNVWQEVADTGKRVIPNCDGSEEERALAREEYRRKLADCNSIFSYYDKKENAFETIELIKPSPIENNSSASFEYSKEMLISFEHLLLMALAITLNIEPSRQFYQSEHLLSRFEEAKLKEKELIDSFFETLYKCRLLMDCKIVWQESGGDFEYNILTDDKEHRLEKFQSMLFVSHQNEFYRWLPNYIKWLIDNPNSSETSELEELKKIDRILHPYIPLVGELNYNKVDRYWFWRLDYELWDRRKDENGWLKNNPELIAVVNSYIFRANRSIEHLHPQTPTDNKSEAWDSDNLNRFGNLAMISSSFNSLQSNESAGVKMERIHHQVETSQLQSLKMLHMWLTYKDGETYRDGETWTIEKAILHEEMMYTYISNLST